MGNTAIEAWMYSQPKWQQEIMRLLCENDEIDDSNLERIKKIFESEMIIGKTEDIPPLPQGWSNVDHSMVPIQLLLIDSPLGINNLQPKHPLEFGDRSLSIVYGVNGSGKSGYVRLLKKLTYPLSKEVILPCFYSVRPERQSCNVSVDINGTFHNFIGIDINSPERVECAHMLDVFDNNVASSYVRERKTYSFEPSVLVRLSKLSETCATLAHWLEEKIKTLQVTKLTIPDNISNTSAVAKYINLEQEEDFSVIEQAGIWIKADEIRRNELHKMLYETDPEVQLEILEKKLHAARELLRILTNISTKVSKSSQENIVSLYTAMINAEKSAVEAGIIIGGQSDFPIDADTWKAMWQAAKQYSEKTIYPGKTFPVLSDGAKCPFCQQELTQKAIHRLHDFDEYVQGQLTVEADNSKKSYFEHLQSLQISETSELLRAHCEVLDMDGEIIAEIEALFISISEYLSGLQKANNLPEIRSFFELETICKAITDMSETMSLQKEDCKNLLDPEGRKKKIAEHYEYVAKKWLHDNMSDIRKEFNKSLLLKKWSAAKNSLNTRKLTEKCKQLSEELITNTYIERFNSELQRLGSKVSVKCKTSGSIGRLLKSLVLVKNGHECDKPEQILSEGEAKIVSLAAFLADTTGGYSTHPLVFDDPISSLDHQYEQRVIKRLIDLTVERQVIVFTHRLSFRVGLSNAAQDLGIEYKEIEIITQPWGSGEVRDISLSSIKRSDKKLKYIQNTCLSKASKILSTDGYGDEYYRIMKATCSEIRIAIEDLVADELLCGIVKRFDPAIHTANGLKKLVVITEPDCELIDKMMSKYSFTEHSQSEELPQVTFCAETPDFAIDVITNDIHILLEIIDSLKKRRSRITP